MQRGSGRGGRARTRGGAGRSQGPATVWKQPAEKADDLNEGEVRQGTDGESLWKVVCLKTSGAHRWYRTHPKPFTSKFGVETSSAVVDAAQNADDLLQAFESKHQGAVDTGAADDGVGEGVVLGTGRGRGRGRGGRNTRGRARGKGRAKLPEKSSDITESQAYSMAAELVAVPAGTASQPFTAYSASLKSNHAPSLPWMDEKVVQEPLRATQRRGHSRGHSRPYQRARATPEFESSPRNGGEDGMEIEKDVRNLGNNNSRSLETKLTRSFTSVHPHTFETTKRSMAPLANSSCIGASAGGVSNRDFSWNTYQDPTNIWQSNSNSVLPKMIAPAAIAHQVSAMTD
jgi:hypothetical protein